MIYMDNAATTRLHPEVINAMLPYMGKRYANPSGAYTFSADVKNDINNAEAFLAKTIQAKPQEIYITSGGTESDNWALKAAFEAYKAKGNHIITTKIEHHAILHSAQFLEKHGFEVTYVDVDENGVVKLDELEAESLTECIAVDVDCCLPQLEDILSQYGSASELVRHAIDFGYIWSEQGQGEPRWADKFMAVMELEDCRRLDYALDLAQNLHCYHFMPRDMDLADYGKELAKRDGIYPKDELLASCFDAEGYANQRMKRMGLSAAEHGFVSWNGTELNFEYSQPEMEPTMSM